MVYQVERRVLFNVNSTFTFLFFKPFRSIFKSTLTGVQGEKKSVVKSIQDNARDLLPLQIGRHFGKDREHGTCIANIAFESNIVSEVQVSDISPATY